MCGKIKKHVYLCDICLKVCMTDTLYKYLQCFCYKCWNHLLETPHLYNTYNSEFVRIYDLDKKKCIATCPF